MDTQPEPTLLEFIRYNTWANQQVLAACEKLSQVQLTTPIPGAYGFILNTIGHMLAAEADYNIAYLYYLRGEYTRAIDLYRSTREMQ